MLCQKPQVELAGVTHKETQSLTTVPVAAAATLLLPQPSPPPHYYQVCLTTWSFTTSLSTAGSGG